MAVSKTVMGASPSGVRIPLSPPRYHVAIAKNSPAKGTRS